MWWWLLVPSGIFLGLLAFGGYRIYKQQFPDYDESEENAQAADQ